MEKSEKVNETDRESACSWPLQISAPPICLLSDNYVCLCTAVSAHFLSILHSRSFTKPLNNDYLSLNLSFLLSLKLFSYIPSSVPQFSTARVPAEWAKEEYAILSSLCFPASYNGTLTCCLCLSSDLGVRRMPSTCISVPGFSTTSGFKLYNENWARKFVKSDKNFLLHLLLYKLVWQEISYLLSSRSTSVLVGKK